MPEWRVTFFVDETIGVNSTDNNTYWTYSNNLIGGEVEIDGTVHTLDPTTTLGQAYFESDGSTWETVRFGPGNGPGWSQLMTDLGDISPGPMFGTRGQMGTYVVDGAPSGPLRTTPFNGTYVNFLSCNHGTGVGCLNTDDGQTIKLWSTEGDHGPIDGGNNAGDPPPTSGEPVPFLGPLPLALLAMGLGGAGVQLTRREDA